MKISLAHPSARPHEWSRTRDLWLRAAASPGNVEYCVCFDWGTCEVTAEEAAPARRVWNFGARCSVDATNVAAQCCTGGVIVVISDDIYPCADWDLRVARYFQDAPESRVLRVMTGGTADARWLLTVQILNRARYEQLGYLFHPAYISMYADDEFTAHAERDGCVVNAPEILFRHEHWTTGERQMDDVYRRQNDRRRYQYGESLYKFREQRGFPNAMTRELMDARINAV